MEASMFHRLAGDYQCNPNSLIAALVPADKVARQNQGRRILACR